MLYNLLLIAMTLVNGQMADGFTSAEKQLIGSPLQGMMRVLTVAEAGDLELLRTASKELSVQEIGCETFNTLVARMLETVLNPDNPGVGIAAPQVGILRRLVLVQRFDKEGEPFEVYVNPRIEEYCEDKRVGMEGCLSVPEQSGSVMRSDRIKISYVDLQTRQRVKEEVEDFTAVIFQHEIDHLDGILYTDRMEEKKIRTFSYTPREVCSGQMDIVAENDTIIAINVTGGCSGNSAGMVALLEGMNVYDAIDRLEDIKCGSKGTSCPDQLAKALRLMMMQDD